MAGSQLTAAIRPMIEADLAAIVPMELEIYPQPWSERVFRGELVREDRRYFVAEEGTAVVGYGGLMLIDEDAHITTVAVQPGARSRGLGTRLMLRLVDAALDAGARHLTLEVRLSNHSARELYRRFGLAPVGLRKNYYRDEDALIMWAIDIDTEEYGERLAHIRAGLLSEDPPEAVAESPAVGGTVPVPEPEAPVEGALPVAEPEAPRQLVPPAAEAEAPRQLVPPAAEPEAPAGPRAAEGEAADV